MSRIEDICDYGLCAALAVALAFALLILAIEFLVRMVGHVLVALWRSLTRPCQ